jgi:decaprenyl-phosphate phosphoribosyltransferase
MRAPHPSPARVSARYFGVAVPVECIRELRPYVQIARPDHWFKNAFMVFGVLLACFYEPQVATVGNLVPLAIAIAATCLIASSNYVLNELLDGPRDVLHPLKRHRPVPSGLVRPWIAYAEWIGLGTAGMGLASLVNPYFAMAALLLWASGVAYNIPPLRLKEWVYVDVLSESANNAIRLLIGWFALVTDRFPPVSLILSYWMLGAFFMAMKRFAEYRQIGDPSVAAAYRRSFARYTEDRLLVSVVIYATTCALFAGIFIVRYHVELILSVPFMGGVFGYYLLLGLRANSPVQNPERLYRERGFFAYIVVTFSMFVALMFMEIPVMYDWFNIEPSQASPLWTLGAKPEQ